VFSHIWSPIPLFLLPRAANSEWLELFPQTATALPRNSPSWPNPAPDPPASSVKDQVRQAVEKSNKKAYGRKKVLRFYDVRPDEKKEGAKAVCN
jgi:hypothetical protein